LAEELITLTKSVLPLLKDIPHKSKTAKIIRTLFDHTQGFLGMEQQLIDLSEFVIKWCDENNRTFLRHRIQT